MQVCSRAILIVAVLTGIAATSIEAGEWVQKTSGAESRQDHSAALYNGKIYIFGGLTEDGVQHDLWRYDIETDTWAHLDANTPLTKRDCHSAVVYESSIYIFGGYSNQEHRDLWEYSIDTATWTQKADGPSPGRHHHSAVVYGDKMYVFGGKDKDTAPDEIYLADLWAYSFATDTWTQKATCPKTRYLHTAEVYNDKMYVYGGGGGAGAEDDFFDYANDMWIYDFTSNTWTQGTDGPFHIVEHSSVVYEGSMYIFGGAYFEGGEIIVSDEVWKYDFAAGVWTQQTKSGLWPLPRLDHRAISYSDSMYVYGGQDFVVKFNEVWEFQFAASGDCIDSDDDGYGNPASSECTHPELDCNDGNPDVNPGMTEIPENGIDDDCDGGTPPWGTPASIIDTGYKRSSDIVNSVILLIIPMGAVILLRILRRKK